MIITDRMGSSAMVDVAQPQDLLDAACEAAARECVRMIVRSGEDVGAFIRPESVWVTRALSEVQPSRMQVRVEWSPDPAEGVELRGGPFDGETPGVRRGDDGRPAELLVIPAPMRDITADNVKPSDPWHLAETYSYTLTGIDSERDRWVYTYRP